MGKNLKKEGKKITPLGTVILVKLFSYTLTMTMIISQGKVREKQNKVLKDNYSVISL